MEVTVASHNTMHGVFLEALVERYRRLTQEQRVDVLCLQENRSFAPTRTPPLGMAAGQAGETHAELLGRALGFQCVCLQQYPALAVLLHPEWQLKQAFLVPLPRLPRLNWFERLYIRDGKVKQKYALVASAEARSQALTVANFHLDTAGDNAHRKHQVAALAQGIAQRGLSERLVACGDTNAFTWSRARAGGLLQELLAPLTQLCGAELGSPVEPTHYFARQREELFTHRVVSWLGKLGVDHPLPYDVICSNLSTVGSRKITTEESDHDLVCCTLRWPSSELAPVRNQPG